MLAGWSFGGALAYEVAHQLGNDKVKYIALLDTTQPSEPIPDTMEETKARWGRYAQFAKDTYGLEFDVPYELLETAGEDALLTICLLYTSPSPRDRQKSRMPSSA